MTEREIEEIVNAMSCSWSTQLNDVIMDVKDQLDDNGFYTEDDEHSLYASKEDNEGNILEFFVEFERVGTNTYTISHIRRIA